MSKAVCSIPEKVESPVTKYYFKKNKVQWEKTCWNIGEPSSKAKYYKFRDSKKYCKGKVEKEVGKIKTNHDYKILLKSKKNI